MITEFAQYLTDMQKIADDSNIIVEARHFDVLDYYFKAKQSPLDAFKEYSKFRARIYALNFEELPDGNLEKLLDWVSNNWIIPSDDSMWKLDKDNVEFENTIEVKIDSLFTSEEVVKMYLSGKGEF